LVDRSRIRFRLPIMIDTLTFPSSRRVVQHRCGTEVTAMDVTPVGAIGSGHGSPRLENARDNDYDRAVRIARRFRDAEPDRRRRQPQPQQQPAPRKPAEEEFDSGPRAGVELDTYL
jgi:hypothetical protein